MLWFIFNILCLIGLIAYVISKIVLALLDKEYQNLWYKEKAMRLKANPRVSNAELCEYYVMFCKRFNCKVEF